jgi:hypothetical protein
MDKSTSVFEKALIGSNYALSALTSPIKYFMGAAVGAVDLGLASRLNSEKIQ